MAWDEPVVALHDLYSATCNRCGWVFDYAADDVGRALYDAVDATLCTVRCPVCRRSTVVSLEVHDKDDGTVWDSMRR